MDDKLRTALIADYETRLKAQGSVDDLDDTDLELRSKWTETLDVLRSLETPPPAPASPPELRSRVEFRDIFAHIGRGETPKGAWGELVSELNLDSDRDGFELPLDLLAPPETRSLETRADAATEVTLTDFDAGVVRVLDRLFGQSDLAFLGIRPTPVRAGEAVAIVITGGDTGSTPARGAAADAAALTYTSTKLTPKRAVTRGLYDIEGAAAWGQLQSVMQRDMRAALNNKMDDLLIAQVLSDLTDPSGASTVIAHGPFLELATGGIDGKLAYSLSDVSLLMGAATYAKGLSLYRGNNDAVNAIAKLTGGGARIRPSARIAAPATFSTQDNNQFVIRSLANAGQDFFFGVWQNARLIVDPYSRSAHSQTALTLTMLYAADMLRTDRFAQLAVKTAS